jgi:thermitase
MSLGGRSNSSRLKAYKDAIKYANKKDAIVVVAAGNSNTNAKQYSPANTPGVITVSAVDTLIGRASFSNYIQDVEMGIAAPGVQIYSTTPTLSRNGKYAAFNGTSMATPYVAGLVGLMRSLDPKINTKEVYKILDETGKPTKDTKKTGKLIYPVEAVKRVIN